MRGFASPHPILCALLVLGWLFARRCWVLPEEYCGFLGDDFWFILVFSFAWFDSVTCLALLCVFSTVPCI